jgi:uncharacterized membrane protein YvlD (DUF360 family)
MKHLIRIFLFHVFALWVLSEVYAGFDIAGGVKNVLIAGLALSLLMLITKPILKILFIPINFLTFGIAGLFIDVIVVYLLTLLMPEVTVSQATIPGFSFAGFVIPSVHLTYIWSLIFISASITIMTHILHEVSEQ